jgi:hypothetical protein
MSGNGNVSSFKRKHSDDDDDLSKRSKSQNSDHNLTHQQNTGDYITNIDYNTIDDHSNQKQQINKQTDGKQIIEIDFHSNRDTPHLIATISSIHKQYLLDEARKLGLAYHYARLYRMDGQISRYIRSAINI